MSGTSNAGKRLLIIGGSSGIGLKVAELAAAQGMSLHIVGRNQERLAEAQALVQRAVVAPATVETSRLDAHDHAAVVKFFTSVKPFDHLVSMVGDVNGGGFVGADVAAIRHVIESKFFTNLVIAQNAIPKVNAGGSFTFTSGTGGRAQNASGSYIGNLAVNALVEGLAVELAPKVRVNSVCPTWTLTPFWRDVPRESVLETQKTFSQNIPLRRTAQIEELSSAYVFLMNNGFITGQHIAVDGGVMLGS
jgi:NAD(P)-dependent dehydrogenase (short-subunit alcohol dehydrogenase family)